MEERSFLVRHGAPNKYDHAPFGTRCKVIQEGDVFFYIQISKDDANPRWEPVSSWDEIVIS